jgi:predicted TIM-barrel fold metal-dependent hydrolase
MDKAGVSKICLTSWYRPGRAVFSNEDVAEFTRAYPDRFIGIASFDLMDPVGAVKEIEQYVRKEGFKGVRVVPWLWALPPTDRH